MPFGVGHRFAQGRPLRLAIGVALALAYLLAGCGGPAYRTGELATAPRRYHPPPGPPEDPWGPYIRQASSRFSVSEHWIRAVMRQELGGREDAQSSAGAMGLMQVMPETYAELQARYGLGNDPYEPHDNILAGTAYIREMYDRYGSPGFLAAYNAGPNRLDSYLGQDSPLPDETVGYLAAIAPRLGSETPATGPLAVYAAGAGQSVPWAPPAALASGGTAACDPDAAYDPRRYCAPLAPAPGPAPSIVLASSAGTVACDPDAAYDPDRPCAPATPAPSPEVSAIYTPSVLYTAPLPPTVPSPAAPILHLASVEPRPQPSVSIAPREGWAIQVGAFVSPVAAQVAAADARASAPDLLGRAPIDVPATTPFGGTVVYRARLTALSEPTAAAACARLSARRIACMVVTPGR